jgi:hypothetical protein
MRLLQERERKGVRGPFATPVASNAPDQPGAVIQRGVTRVFDWHPVEPPPAPRIARGADVRRPQITQAEAKLFA